MRKISFALAAALLFEAVSFAYDASIITQDDLTILKSFDARYYKLRKSSAKRQAIHDVVNWCWQNMRVRSEAGSFDVNAYTEVQSQTYYAPASSVQGAGITFRPNDQSQVRVSRDTLGRTRVDALLNLGIFDNAEAKREDQRLVMDKTKIAALVGEIAALLSELRLLDVEDEAAHLEEVRLKARSKTGVIAEDNRLDHLAKNTETYRKISTKEAELDTKQKQLEIYIQGDKLEVFYKLLQAKL